MKKNELYTSGQFAALTHVTKKTLRYYNEHNILNPSYTAENGNHYYSDHDLARMQQILILKYLGFTLADIRELTLNIADMDFIESSLLLQKKLIDDRIEQLAIVSKTLSDTAQSLHTHKNVDWSRMLELTNEMSVEHSLKTQYLNASNISTRINLHNLYSQNNQGWFPWIYKQCNIEPDMNILELGCGDGSFWLENIKLIPESLHIILSDISSGMLRDARRKIGQTDSRFSYKVFDCHSIPYNDHSFDLVIANHVLFYCNDISAVCREIQRTLKPEGTFICSTYGSEHMKEVSQIAASFDNRINLSAEKLHEHFGRENGQKILEPFFEEIVWIPYTDFLFLTEAEPLIAYILSCHGNQNQYIIDRFSEFRSHVRDYIGNGIKITKDAGIFLCTNQKKTLET